ncbi:MAG: hypothetical protein KKB50_06200 [Planctomycetes bacterium]|nr:hypothetical protein [Planctomycetota bacterium]
MRRFLKWFLGAVAVLALAVGSGLVWYNLPERNRFYTDADTIRQALETATPRDILWQPPARLSELLNTSGQDYEPRLGWDGLTLYFVRGKAGENADVFFAQRTPDGWTEPAPLEAINTGYDELGPEPSSDGEALYFYSDRPGGQGGYDVWVTRRGLHGWQPPTNLGPAVNSEFNDYGPALAPDGALLYFASNRPRARDSTQPDPHAWPATVREDLFRRTYDLYQSALTEAGATTAVAVAALNTVYNEGAACVSPAGDFLYFASDRPGGEGGYDLYRARRVRGGLEPPTNLGEAVNTPANELDPGLTQLGFALYFSSDRSVDPPTGDRPPDYNLYYTSAREVFTDTELHYRPPIDWAALWVDSGPYLLALLLSLLLLLLLLTLVRDLRDRKLSLLARCLIASLMAHLLVMILCSFWQVGGALADVFRRGGRVQITLSTPGQADELALQIRGRLTEVELPSAPVEEPRRAEATFDPELPETTAALVPEHMPVNLSELPRPPSPTRDAPPHAVDPPEHVRLAALVEQPTLPELAVPNETQRVTAAETDTLADVQPDATMPRDRPRVAYATSQPVTAVTNVALRPQQGVARDEQNDRTSIAATSAPRDTEPQSPVSRELPPRVTLTEQPLDVALPTETPPENATSEQSAVAQVVSAGAAPPRAQPPDTTSAASPRPATAMLDAATRPHEPREFALASAVEVVVRDAAAPTPAAWRVRDSRDTGVAVPQPPELELPRLERSTAERAAEVRTAVVAAAPASMRPTIAAQTKLPPGRAGSATTILLPDAKTTLPRESSTLAVARPSDAPPNSLAAGARKPSVAAPLADLSPFEMRLPPGDTTAPNRLAQRSKDQRRSLLERMGGSERTENAVDLALAWLARHQSPDGRWDSDGFDDACGQCGGETEYEVDAALTSLSVLCFLGADHTHLKAGPYQDSVQRALAWLLARQASDGDLRTGETLYSQGIATLALAEAYAMTGDPTLREPIERAVDFIAAARNTRYGGWRYIPGQAGDTSVLGWQVMALSSAQACGIDLPDVLFEAARAWLELVEASPHSGRYSYRPGQRPTIAMTAEAVFVQQLLGAPREDSRLRSAVEYIASELPDWEERLNTYNWYYTTLALFHHQGPQWPRWNAALTGELLEHQHTRGARAGSWDPDGEWAPVGGRVYQTALCTLMLEVYYRYLPMYGRGEPVAATPPPDDAIGTISGRVRDAETGQALSGAAVRLDLPDAAPLVAVADADGSYTLPAPRVPDFIALSATHTGYLPAAVNVPAARLREGQLTQDFELQPARDDVIVIEATPEVHHLGNDRFEGRINSQFQRTAEGRSFEAEFYVSDEQLTSTLRAARLTLMAKGVQCPHRISVNGHLLPQRLDESPADGSFGEFTVAIAPEHLVEGINTLRISAVSCQGDLDDFEFVNLQLDLSR